MTSEPDAVQLERQQQQQQRLTMIHNTKSSRSPAAALSQNAYVLGGSSNMCGGVFL